MTPDYWRAWRAAHPEYRERQNALRNRRRALQGRGDRSAEYRRRSAQRAPDEAPLEAPRHPIMDEALAVASRYARPDRGRVIFDPLYEEAVCVAALAICAGQDADAETAAYVRQERDWSRRIAPLWLA